jgi:N4-gp56 family major capsid protein
MAVSTYSGSGVGAYPQQNPDLGNAVTFSSLYDPLHLKRVTTQMMWDKWAQARFVPSNSGVKEMFAFRYRSLRAATTPLTEGVLPTETNIVREKVSYTIAQYGSYIKYTDQLDLFDVDNIKSQFTDILGDQAALTGDIVIRDIVNAGTQVIYSGSLVSRAAVAAEATKANALLTTTNLKLAVLKLKNARAGKYKEVNSGSTKIGSTPIRSAYVGVVHPNVVEDLRGLTGWKDVESYAYTSDIMPDEVGSYGDIRFVENLNAYVDETGAHPVYCTLILAKEAYASVSVRGKKGTEMIFKPLNSGGVENALNQVGSIGWKMYCGAKILNELFMVRLESQATNEVAEAIRYEDNKNTVV